LIAPKNSPSVFHLTANVCHQVNAELSQQLLYVMYNKLSACMSIFCRLLLAPATVGGFFNSFLTAQISTSECYLQYRVHTHTLIWSAIFALHCDMKMMMHQLQFLAPVTHFKINHKKLQLKILLICYFPYFGVILADICLWPTYTHTYTCKLGFAI